MERLSQGQIIAAGAAVVLLVSMFLPWGGADVPDLPPGVPTPAGADDSVSLWELPGSDLDVYLLITAVVALIPALLAVTGGAEEFSFASAATFLLGVVGVILVAVWLTIDFPDGAERKFGAFLGLAAVLAVAIGGFRAMQDEVAAEL
jgi:hypothetical protein